MAFSDQLWGRLIGEIEDRQVIPVIGPELLVLDLPGESILLSRYIARRLAGLVEIPEATLPPEYTLDDLVCRYLRRPGSDPEELYYGVREVMAQYPCPTPEPLRKMAAITHFDFYVSTTFDSLLEQALNQVRFGGLARTRSFVNSRVRSPVDVPVEYSLPLDERGNKPAPNPAVYHLFGKLNPLNDYTLREEDLLHFCYRLQSRDLRPPNLFDLFRTRKILALGCGFPGWLTRFFLAAAKGDQLFIDGARGVIADRSSSADFSLVLFLERRKTTIYTEGDAVSFVDNLYRRWMDRFGGAGAQVPVEMPPPEMPDFRPDSIFISYASEDRTDAQAIRDVLEHAGLDVWFDQGQLEAGDMFLDKILRNIEKCSVFLPVISRHVAVPGRRFFFREWNKAIEESQYRPKDDPFIQPLLIDDTPIDAPHVPEAFRERHWQKAEGGRLPDEFVTRVRQHIRGLRRERGPV